MAHELVTGVVTAASSSELDFLGSSPSIVIISRSSSPRTPMSEKDGSLAPVGCKVRRVSGGERS